MRTWPPLCIRGPWPVAAILQGLAGILPDKGDLDTAEPYRQRDGRHAIQTANHPRVEEAWKLLGPFPGRIFPHCRSHIQGRENPGALSFTASPRHGHAGPTGDRFREIEQGTDHGHAVGAMRQCDGKGAPFGASCLC